jgi:hypothetical protein
MKVTRRLLLAFVVVVIAVALLPSCNLLKLIPKSFDVPATVEWYESGVNVDDGDQVSILAEGLVSITDLTGISGNGPDGNEDLGTPLVADVTYGTSVADDQPMPDELYGALVAKIGANGDVFLVGSELTFVAPSDGELHFSVNDRPVDNNEGFFSVVVRFLRDPIR